MCLILTLIAAMVSLICYMAKRVLGRGADKCMLAVSAMYWSAELMWCAMGASAKISGGDFLEMSAKDAAIGAVVVVAGVAMYFFLRARNKAQGAPLDKDAPNVKP